MTAIRSRHHRRHFFLSVSAIAFVVMAVTIVVIPMNALWLRPLPIPNADRLVVVTAITEETDGSRFSEAGLERLKQTSVFADVAGQVIDRDMFVGLRPNLRFEGGGRLEVLSVTSNYFDVVKISVAGRAFTDADVIPGAPPVAVISDRLWRTQLGTRPNLIGSVIEAHPFPIRVIGIAAPEFHGVFRGESVDVWIPHSLLARLNGLAETDLIMPMISLCRLSAGWSVHGSQVALSAATGRERVVLPITDLFAGGESPLVRIREGRLIAIIGLMAVLVLLAGSATLMALILVRYEHRRAEIRIRLFMGATPFHLARLFLTELAVVLAAGLAGGLVLLASIVRWLPRFRLPGGVDFGRLDLSIDWRVMVIAFVAACLAAITAAALPIMRAIHATGEISLTRSLSGPARGTLRASRYIVFLHTTATVIVLIAAAVFVRAVSHGLHLAPGFDVSRVLFVSVQTRPIVEQDVQDRDQRGAADSGKAYALIEALRQIPSVEAVVAGGSPIGSERERAFRVPRQVRIDGGEPSPVRLGWLSVGPGYLQAVGTPLVSGREGHGAEAVITPKLASELWPGQSPLGHRIAFGAFKGEVVGVAGITVGSVRLGESRAVLSFEQQSLLAHVITNSNRFALTIKTPAPQTVKPSVLHLTENAFSDATWIEVLTGDEILAVDIGQQRLAAWFFSTYGLVASLFAVFGIYGLVSYVARTREPAFGIMIALGARHSTIILRAVEDTLRPVLAGAMVGVLSSVLLSRITASFLLNQAAVDPVVFACVATAVIVSSTLASLAAAFPLRRTSPLTVFQPPS
jgi:putative ABC transport system permease protein